MNKNLFNTISSEIEQVLWRFKNEVSSANLELQKKYILEDSPYSKCINDAISSYAEFLFYYNLKLKEAFVTRPSLIKELDLDLWVSCENKTNRELLEEGKSPYAYDSEGGKIEIHHIGQQYDSPFAELTIDEHSLEGNSKLLHEIQENSWRNQEQLKNKFYTEKAHYWKLRASGTINLSSGVKFKKLPHRSFSTPEEISQKLKVIIEYLFSEASIEDLNYISNLAESYALVKEIGVKSISEFVNKERQDTPIVCTFCGESDCISHGSYKTSGEKIKRYKCRKCGKVFTQVNNSIISGSNLSFIEWMRFIDCLFNGFSVAKTAKICNLSERSVQTNRYKLFYALKCLDDEIVLHDNVVLDETYFTVSYKGNHSANPTIIPRKSRKRGGENHVPGTSKEKVCVACALDDNGISIARVCGLGSPTTKKLSYTLSSALKSENIDTLYADKETSIQLFAQENQINLKSAKLLRKGNQRATNQIVNKDVLLTNKYLQKMNSYHKRLHSFIDKFSGISSANLAGYVYLFAWKERNKNRDKNEAYRELFAKMTERNTHISYDEICSGLFLPNPFRIDAVKKDIFRNQKRADEIYALYAEGMLHKEIAKIYSMTNQGIGRIIRKYSASHLAYSTKKDKEKEEKLLKKAMPRGYRINYAEKFVKLYYERKAWTGNPKEFYENKAREHNLSKQTIKSRIAKGQRIVDLKDAFFITDTFEYASLKQVYNNIYDEFNYLKAQNIPKLQCYDMLAEKYNYECHNIMRIIGIMKKDTTKYFGRENIRLTHAESINRDKAVFIDYLHWKGSRENFCIWASEKYKLSKYYVNEIIHYCLSADIKRYDML
ncbi:MAG: IS1595 family transposase [Clostridia bacterium]|nr:IS1595 family transposase [Clostridia bacterium]